jgi:ketosteroid isomerase-like protein
MEQVAQQSVLASAPITGRESLTGRDAALVALIRFYQAFNARDRAAMEANWHNGGDIAMDNPLGGIKRGWTEIGAVYERLFAGPARVVVEFYDYTLHRTPEMFYAVGRERGHFERDGETIELAIRTSRVFRHIAGAWRQVHHHGSIDDPELPARYQRAVLGR